MFFSLLDRGTSADVSLKTCIPERWRVTECRHGGSCLQLAFWCLVLSYSFPSTLQFTRQVPLMTYVLSYAFGVTQLD